MIRARDKDITVTDSRRIYDFYLIRHGETDYNKEQLAQGNIEVPLNEAGRQQAFAAAAELRRMGLSFDLVLSSPLGRAAETGEIVSGIPQSDPRFILIPELHEMAFGELEGKPFLQNQTMLTFNKHPEQYIPAKGGETVPEVFARTRRALELCEKAAERLDNEGRLTRSDGRTPHILVASHGMAIRGMLANVRHTGIEDVWKTIVGNCDVFHLRYEAPRGSAADLAYFREMPKTLSHSDPYDPHESMTAMMEQEADR